MLDTLAKKVDPKHAALIVVDVQNDFCAEGGMMAREGLDLTRVHDMIPRLQRLIEGARSAGVFTVYIQSIYGLAGNEYLSEAWLEQAGRTRKGSYTKYPVCAPGSWNGDFYEGISPGDGDVIVNKYRFDAFESTPLDLILRSKEIRTVLMTGVAANVCVETTSRRAFVMDYHVVFVEDCTATYSPEEHSMTVRNVDRYFGQVVTHEDVIDCWKGREKRAVRTSKAGAA
ncbi:MAG: cysteine hydrolase family protein [Actinomycetota bacterium]